MSHQSQFKKNVLSAMLLSGVTFVSPSFAADSWFVPKTSQPAPVKKAPAPAATQQQLPAAPAQPPVLPVPNVPASPVLSKEAPPPAAVIGVINISAVMDGSTAAQEIQNVVGARKDALQRAAAKAENDWQAKQAQFQEMVEAGKATRAQLEAKARSLQEERIKYQRDFANKARIVQEAYQVAFHQIERELEQPNGIISQVAAAHGMNLVIHGEQVVLHVDGQDVSREVADQLNKVLPRVIIPAANEDPEVMAKSGKYPTTLDEERQMAAAASASAPK